MAPFIFWQLWVYHCREMKRAILATLISAAAVGATLAPLNVATANDPAAEEWSIGPTIRGRNYSVGMPSRLQAGQDGPSFEFPYPNSTAGHVHAITVPVRSLAGAKRITLTYRIDAASGVRFYGQENGGPGWLSLFFQQRGDKWTAKGQYGTYRWYSPDERIVTLRPGVHTISIRLNEEWNAVVSWKRSTNPAGFKAAVENAASVGFVFGSSSGLGHGVYATGPTKFTILDFRID